MNLKNSVLRIFVVFLMTLLPVAARAQQTLGAINGTLTDSSGAIIQGAEVKVRNVDTNLEVTAKTKNDGSFSLVDLPIGSYSVTFSKTGFKTEVHSQILIRGNLTTTVNATLQPGEVSATVTVTSTPLLNQTDTTNGYTLGSEVIENLPLGTGSFTQLAVLSPGVHADFLSGAGTNAGLGNQAIWSNGQRDTSNSISFNSVNANNLFNGKTTSTVTQSRFILNTGENFGLGNQSQTNTSVYDAIGQGIPTPPVETIEELHVSASMYDASQGANSGAHIELTTKSGTNSFHGQLYEYHQTSGLNASPYAVNSAGAAGALPPGLKSSILSSKRNVFGGTFGGPILKNKAFFFGSYQGQRVHDGLNGAVNITPTLPFLNDTIRQDKNQLAALVTLDGNDPMCGQPNHPACFTITGPQVDPVAFALFNARSNGQFIIPNPTVDAVPANTGFIGQFRGNSVVHGPPSTFSAEQINGNVDYDFSAADRLSGKYYFQTDPSTSPFAVSQVLGFPQSLRAGSQVFSLDNTSMMTSNFTWEQRLGFIRTFANSKTAQPFTPGGLSAPLNVLGSHFFPGINISNADTFMPGTSTAEFDSLRFGPATNFANSGVFQNQWEAASSVNWLRGRHNVAFGFNASYTQLNIINRENEVATFNFNSFRDFLTGTLQGRSSGQILNGETNRYFRAKSAGLYANDSIKVKSNLTVNVGLRWDWDGPLYEKYGVLTSFRPNQYSYNLATDTVQNIGLVVPGNNKKFCGSKQSFCVNDSTLTGRQWLFEPRIGLAWSPGFVKNVVVRAGFGLYADRGEFFTEFSNSAGLGISGPFGVTTQLPFTTRFANTCTGPMCLTNNPFGTSAPPAPPSDFSQVIPLVGNQAALSGCTVVTPTCTPTNNPQFAFLFGGYDPRNTLPYSENWSLDLQWQPSNTVVLTLGYVGNHGLHEVMPIPFNEPGLATPNKPINGQIYSYGAQPLDANFTSLPTEQVNTVIAEFGPSDGNTALRAPFIGYNPNSDFWEAEGISHYNALELGVNKRLSQGLQVNASYTWSHALDEQSALGLFFNGNDPLKPRSAYASSDFDRTHVLSIGYVYQFPKIANASRLVDAVANGWGLAGVTVAESGLPFAIIDFSGSVGDLYFSGDDFITNPILPLNPGVSPKQAQQGTTGFKARKPYVNPNVFAIPFVAPGTTGNDPVPPCGTTTGGTTGFCDMFETTFGNNGRNLFRGPFQTRFDFSVSKNISITERFKLKYEADFFNVFNHTSYDVPNQNVSLLANGAFFPQPSFTNPPPASQGAGVLQGAIGSPRLIQMSLHLTF